mmetsp:Transcript_33705/g.97225  ORF Transcript_33705/g.97225 Transcript_33705/m.97225 type:complete len:317 (-) Transcript_33705:1224-2174(-)
MLLRIRPRQPASQSTRQPGWPPTCVRTKMQIGRQIDRQMVYGPTRTTNMAAQHSTVTVTVIDTSSRSPQHLLVVLLITTGALVSSTSTLARRRCRPPRPILQRRQRSRHAGIGLLDDCVDLCWRQGFVALPDHGGEGHHLCSVGGCEAGCGAVGDLGKPLAGRVIQEGKIQRALGLWCFDGRCARSCRVTILSGSLHVAVDVDDGEANESDVVGIGRLEVGLGCGGVVCDVLAHTHDEVLSRAVVSEVGDFDGVCPFVARDAARQHVGAVRREKKEVQVGQSTTRRLASCRHIRVSPVQHESGGGVCGYPDGQVEV